MFLREELVHLEESGHNRPSFLTTQQVALPKSASPCSNTTIASRGHGRMVLLTHSNTAYIENIERIVFM